MDLKVFIPTFNRPTRQPAYEQWGDRATLVLHYDDVNYYGAFANTVRTPAVGIAEQRDYILNTLSGGRPFIMVDDDVVMLSGPPALRPLDQLGLQELCRLVSELCTRYAHGSVHNRLWITGQPQPYKLHGNLGGVAWFNPALFKEPVRYSGRSNEDLRMQVDLEKQGLPLCMITQFSWVERRKTVGGCWDRFSQKQRDEDLLDYLSEWPRPWWRFNRKGTGFIFNHKQIVLDAWAKAGRP